MWNRFVNVGKRGAMKHALMLMQEVMEESGLLLALCLLERDRAMGDFLLKQCLLPVPIKCAKTGEEDKHNNISVFVTHTRGYSSEICS